MSSGDEAINNSEFDSDDDSEDHLLKNTKKQMVSRLSELSKSQDQNRKRIKMAFDEPSNHPKIEKHENIGVKQEHGALKGSSSESSENKSENSMSDEPEYQDSDDSGNYREKRKRLKKNKEKRKKSSKTRAAAMRDFVDSEASEEDEDFHTEKNARINESEREKIKKIYETRKQSGVLDKLKDMNPEEINRYYEEKERSYEDEVDEEKEIAFLPSSKDPKIFVVKCNAGKEKEACVSLQKKFFELRKADQEISIFSASAVDKIPCCVFIEAFQEMHVRIACDGLLALKKDTVKVIPSKEVRDIFMPDPIRNIKLKPNSFVRVKNGLYMSDLGLVEDVDPGKAVAIIKLVPRMLGAEHGNIKKYTGNEDSRPQKKLFNKDDYSASLIEIFDATNVNKIVYSYAITKEKFENGFIKKKIAIKHLNSENIHPSYEEVNIFKKAEPDENKWNELIRKLTMANDPSKNLKQTVQKGDSVRVVEGDMIGMKGKAVEILPDSIKVDFEGIMGVRDLMEFPINELEKIFLVGEQIEVIGGRFVGRTGSIVSFDEKQAVFISDDTHEELPVFLTDIRKKTTKISSNGQSNSKTNNLEKHDLIALSDGKTIGVVLSVLPDAVTILDCENFVSSQNKIKVSKKFTKSSVARNNHNESIEEKCTVKVIHGMNKNTLALVIKVYGNKVFLLDRNRSQNNGVFVEDVDNCTVLETPSYDKSRKFAIFNNQAKMNMRKEEMAQNSEIQPPRMQTMKNNPMNVRIDLIGQTKRVIKGPYKGFEGIIHSIIENDVRFELSAENKIIKIPLDYLNVNNTEKEALISANARTPLYKNPKSGNFNSYNTGTPAYRPNY